MKPAVDLVRQALSRAKGFEADGDTAHAVLARKLITVYLGAVEAFAAQPGKRARVQAAHAGLDSEEALRLFVSGGTTVAGAAGTTKADGTPLVDLAEVAPLTTEAILAAIEAEATRVATVIHEGRVAAEGKSRKVRDKFLEGVRPGKKAKAVAEEPVKPAPEAPKPAKPKKEVPSE